MQVKTAGMTVLGEDGELRASDYLATDSAAVKKLKSELLCVECAIPEQAMSNPGWDRVRWIRKTQVCALVRFVAPNHRTLSVGCLHACAVEILLYR